MEFGEAVWGEIQMKLRKKDRKNLIKLISRECKVSEADAVKMFDQMTAKDKKHWVRRTK